MHKADSTRAQVRQPASPVSGPVTMSRPGGRRLAQLAAILDSAPRNEALRAMAADLNARPKRAAPGGPPPGSTAQLAPRPTGGSPVVQMNGHPLADDTNESEIPLLNFLRTFDPEGTVQHLILESTDAARMAMDYYRAGRKRGEADAMLFKSILATVELHKSGASASMMGVTDERKLSAEEGKLLAVATEPYSAGNKEWLAEQYGLNPMEVKSVEAYSLPNKNEPDSSHYMGPGKWGGFADGWEALASAMKKLPSLGDLELEVTTYRATREKSETDAMGRLAPETNVRHGAGVMNMGQKHYMSTALTYSVHSGRAEQVGGMTAITGKSGVLINPFGEQGLLDGGEILYPPDVVTRFEGANPEGYKGQGATVPVFHMREVKHPESGQAVVDDKDFAGTARHPRLDSTKLQMIDEIEKIVEKSGTGALDKAREATNIHGAIMYLTVDDLRKLSDRLKHEVSVQRILSGFR